MSLPVMTNNAEPTERDTDLEQAYKRYVSELRHEDSLINHRLTWLLVFQGLLFAALGFERMPRPLFLCIAIVGASASVIALVSIAAAVWSWRRFHKRLLEVGSNRNDKAYFPQLDRHRVVLGFGHIAPPLMSVLFLFAWVFLLYLYSSGDLDELFTCAS